ncbi:MAG: DUF167 domain-containing protein [Planctomycetes bacterium]|nr:DUF167 domain-containing protein [Planctomycetota bacterium]
MLINVKAITGARKNDVKSAPDGLKVYVTAPAVDGKANQAIIKLLAEYFHARKSTINITKGEKSSRKIIEILT